MSSVSKRKPAPPTHKRKRKAELSDKEKLEGSKFRLINEKLYTTDSTTSKDFFEKNPQYFDIMHNGFVNQASLWPVVPVDEVISWIKRSVPADHVIADMGCGDAKISFSVPNKVHSFDFQARNANVVKCDMSHTPLEDRSVNVVVFVLSLMGTNLNDFIIEARRIVKTGGKLLVVEVTSRIEDSTSFIRGIESHGFRLLKHKPLTDFFSWFEFTTGSPTSFSSSIELNPCIYKRR